MGEQSTRPDESSLVFNIVWAGTVVTHLRPFVESQIAHSTARFRFVLNGCPADEIARIESFAADHPDRVVEVFPVSAEETITHGAALDAVRARRDDGPHFCLIDSDIRADRPFLDGTLDLLAAGSAGVAGGRGVWCRSDVVPDGHPGVNGEYFYDADGFFFGSPHFAVYRRDALEDTAARWGVGFGSAGPQLDDAAKARLAEAGHDYWLWDTAKLLGTFFQLDGHTLTHHEPPGLLHIGGMSHYLSPPDLGDGMVARLGRVDRSTWHADRLEVAEFSAAVLTAAVAGAPAPDVPSGLDAETAERLAMVRREILALVDAHPPPAG
jgi:hypothetical protein